MFNIISKELNVNGNLCDVLEKYFEFLNKHEKQIAKEIDSKYDDYRDINENEKTDFINRRLNMSSTHKELSKLDSDKTQMDFDATSLYPSAMWDENSVYPKIETAFAFKPHKKTTFVDVFNNQTFNGDGDESAILTKNITILLILYFNNYQLKKKSKSRS